MKRLLKDAPKRTFDEYLEKEAYAQRMAGMTADHREGIEAFMAKKKPVFEGR